MKPNKEVTRAYRDLFTAVQEFKDLGDHHDGEIAKLFDKFVHATAHRDAQIVAQIGVLHQKVASLLKKKNAYDQEGPRL